FDPGINALSILTEILPAPIHLTAADLEMPENRQTPIAAQLTFSDNVTASFDWRKEEPQTWQIEVETARETLLLTDGGARLLVNGAEVSALPNREYPELYARMAELTAERARDVDLTPMIHVADAMALGRRVPVAPFNF
ncbi:MAG: gfo/Idh/MocA family oxidoreductase, partial [Pseudomonadota bacterium]